MKISPKEKIKVQDTEGDEASSSSTATKAALDAVFPPQSPPVPQGGSALPAKENKRYFKVWVVMAGGALAVVAVVLLIFLISPREDGGVRTSDYAVLATKGKSDTSKGSDLADWLQGESSTTQMNGQVSVDAYSIDGGGTKQGVDAKLGNVMQQMGGQQKYLERMREQIKTQEAVLANIRKAIVERQWSIVGLYAQMFEVKETQYQIDVLTTALIQAGEEDEALMIWQDYSKVLQTYSAYDPLGILFPQVSELRAEVEQRIVQNMSLEYSVQSTDISLKYLAFLPKWLRPKIEFQRSDDIATSLFGLREALSLSQLALLKRSQTQFQYAMQIAKDAIPVSLQTNPMVQEWRLRIEKILVTKARWDFPPPPNVKKQVGRANSAL